jgi:heme-degrading monooxygenase HmoA
MKQTMKFITLSLAVFFISLSAMSQNPFGEVSFIKVKPGMNESYLIDMKTTKKINNGLKANKTISSWQLYRRVYPRGSEMEFDYVTFQVYPGAKEMESRKDWLPWNPIMKELSAKETIDYLTSLGNVRTVVQTELYNFKMGVGAAGKPGDFVQLNLINANPGSNDAVEKMWESLKPVIEECIKAGKLKGYNVWKRTYVTNVGYANDYTVTFSFSSLEQALSWASGKTGMAEEYKKIYPKEDFTAFGTKLTSLRIIVAQELWELVDVTD